MAGDPGAGSHYGSPANSAMVTEMDCAECARLESKRENRKRLYDLANLRLSAAAASGNRAASGTFKILADNAKADIYLLDTEIARHQSAHALAAER